MHFWLFLFLFCKVAQNVAFKIWRRTDFCQRSSGVEGGRSKNTTAPSVGGVFSLLLTWPC